MKISDRIEPLMRRAIDAAVKRDATKLAAALNSFPDNQAVTEAVELALAVVRYVIWDQYQGKPTDAEAEAVAAEITRAEAWAQPTESEVVTFLQRLVNGVPFAGEVPAEQVILAFVSAANLLASCHRENEKWWNYLDRAEAAIEAS